MKKMLVTLLTVLMLVLSASSFNSVKAETNTSDKLYLEILYSNTKIRTGPSTSYAQLSVDGKYQYYTLNEVLEVIGKKTNSSGELWYKVIKIINDKEYETWVREDFVLLYYYEYDEDFEKEISEQNFPASYLNYLRYLHTKHPTWKFVACHTNIEWATILKAENVIGRSLIDGSNEYLRSKADGCYNPSTGQYIPLDGTSWYQANSETIEYFMDPRNFLNEEDIFQFVKLSFTETETPNTIQTILKNTFMSGSVTIDGEEKSYAQIFYDAAEEADVSAFYLATKARYEQGTSGSAAVTGAEFTYNGKTYSSLYNFFNIGATSGADNWKKGLIYANGGENGTNTSYKRPWTDQQKAITGGALWIADGYISEGQDTLYAQKFNYVTKEYWHQYQTNIRAAFSESGSIFKAYKNAGCLENEITFTIPVYLNMPSKTYLPNGTNETPANPTIPDPETPENPDPENPVDPTPGGSGNEGGSGSGSGSSGSYHDEVVSAVNDFFYHFELFESKNNVLGFKAGTLYEIITKYIEENGCEYTAKVYNSENEELKQDSLLATAQKLTISINGDSMTFSIVIKGDVSGDGNISPVDYVLIKNHIMGTSTLDECKQIAADMSEDNNISPVDYVLVKNIIMNGGN